MVSIAIAVLPVWRSPRISSRWPRPIGISASITFRPVCSGTVTGARSMMGAAGRSIGSRASACTGPQPSSGRPSGSMTRPSSPSPTATSITRPVRSTSAPARRWVWSPSSTTPMSSSSRLKAMPKTSPGNRISSSSPMPGRPDTRAMPVDTESMVPTSRGASVGAWRCRAPASAANAASKAHSRSLSGRLTAAPFRWRARVQAAAVRRPPVASKPGSQRCSRPASARSR